MSDNLTPQQKEAVYNRGGRLLVSAAAGSGKTKVLVDRLLSYILDPINSANIDDFLIITYTKAAAAELRGKISAKISEKISEDPNNRHLQKQMQRLYLAKISTVHAFCADILRENAYRLDISADFRVADENECVEIQVTTLQKILEEAYQSAGENTDFCAFIDSQGFGRDDRLASEIVLKVYFSAMCHLDPDGWLDWVLSSSEPLGIQDAAQTVWGRYLMDDLFAYTDLHIAAFKNCIDRATVSDGMQKPVALLHATLDQLIRLRNSSSWDDICNNMNIDYGRLTFPKQCTDLVLIDQIKAVRDACKKGIASKLRRFTGSNVQVLADMEMSTSAARGLITLVKAFKTEYDKAKRSRRILDFSDLEQRTLDLLRGKNRSAITNVARELGQRFREVLVDEYQDSNEVQDAIFSALTDRDDNCFMVGDVKQSIYQFRLADPGIFLEKYNNYLPAAEATDKQGRKILLSSNFRSAGAVIHAVNDVFSCCMSPQVGGLTYGDDELLREGIAHISIPDDEVQLYGIHVENDTYQEEATFVASKIQELIDGSHMVRSGEELRPIVADDIVILLRSPGSVGQAFQHALEQQGIRCVCGGGEDLLQTEEIQTLVAILQVVNNPLQDIYLVSAMMNRVFGFTADDLAALRAGNRDGSMYSAVCKDSSAKSVSYLETLSGLRRKAQISTLSDFLNHVFTVTHIDSIYAALPDGVARVENLRSFLQIAASCEAMGIVSLGRFLEYLTVMSDRGLSVGGEEVSAGAVTIMSIHKSKGLEFPVVFLCGLSRDFNKESARAQVLCDKKLGLGITCVDPKNRVRYPSLPKRAISAKIISEGLSEEMRVLYVAMTRAKDRLIMTYAARNIEEELHEIACRAALSDPVLLTMDAQCPGDWILLTSVLCRDNGWFVRHVSAPDAVSTAHDIGDRNAELPDGAIRRIGEAHAFAYPYVASTKLPSKQTATQLKGRDKDSEIAENTGSMQLKRTWRKPGFVEEQAAPTDYGTLMHLVMQYLRFDLCFDKASIAHQLEYLRDSGYISAEQMEKIPVNQIEAFMNTDFGKSLRSAKNVLREFKFSVLDDAAKFDVRAMGEQILLQGVVDCAVIEDDGIIILDFKTDRVTDDTVQAAVDRYSMQIRAYANAMSRIYDLPVKNALLYFFNLNRFVEIK